MHPIPPIPTQQSTTLTIQSHTVTQLWRSITIDGGTAPSAPRCTVAFCNFGSVSGVVSPRRPSDFLTILLDFLMSPVILTAASILFTRRFHENCFGFVAFVSTSDCALYGGPICSQSGAFLAALATSTAAKYAFDAVEVALFFAWNGVFFDRSGFVRRESGVSFRDRSDRSALVRDPSGSYCAHHRSFCGWNDF